MNHYHTSKLYFNKFLYSAALKYEHLEIRLNDLFSLRELEIKKKFNKILDEWKSLDKNNDFKIVSKISTHYIPNKERKENHKGMNKFIGIIRVYFVDKGDYDFFINTFSDNLIETHAPINQAHENMIKSGIDIEIRPHIFYKKFKYRINFSQIIDYHERKRIGSAITDLHDNTKLLSEQKYKQIFYDRSLYLKDEQDVIYFKMAFSDSIDRCVMVMMPDELKSL